MARNQFHTDASTILKKVSKKIADEDIQSDWDVIQNTLFFAVGVEKLLKSIIFDINPIYILESPDFKNSVPISYVSKVVNANEVHSKPNADVISFQPSVLRASVFSKAVLDNKNTLMKLKNARDIIVHHNLNLLQIDELKILLNRDYYTVLSEISDELTLGGSLHFFNNLNTKLANISSKLQDDVEKQIKLKIEGALLHWNTLKGVATFQRKKYEIKTVEELQKQFAYPTECPSCKNYAIVYTSPVMEFDSYRNEMVQTGVDTKALKCQFCNLEINDYKELDQLKISPEIDQKETVILEYSDDEINNEN